MSGIAMNLRALAFSSTLALLLAALPAHAEVAPPAATPPQPATGEVNELELARQHFTQGTKLYKDGDFDAALVQFERAYEVKPNYKVLYNIGQTYFQLRQYVEARDAMQRYVKEGGAQLEGERLAAVTKDLADLEKRIANVTINVNVADATVLVDGKNVGKTPLPGPVPVSEGQRTISVEAPNRGVLQRLIRVAGGESQTLNLTVEEAKVVVVHTKSTDAKPVHLGPVFWTTAIGAIVLAGGSGVTGFIALKAQHDNQDQQKELGLSPTQLDDSDRRAKNFALTTDILAGAAIACAGVATVVWLTRPSSKSQVGLALTPSSANLVAHF
jgi:tetratricopeptide (TPR) repeat protein